MCESWKLLETWIVWLCSNMLILSWTSTALVSLFLYSNDLNKVKSLSNALNDHHNGRSITFITPNYFFLIRNQASPLPLPPRLAMFLKTDKFKQIQAGWNTKQSQMTNKHPFLTIYCISSVNQVLTFEGRYILLYIKIFKIHDNCQIF